MDFQYMKCMGIDIVIFICCGYKNWLIYLLVVFQEEEGVYELLVDLVCLFLDFFEKYGMVFYFGLYDFGKYWWVQGDF